MKKRTLCLALVMACVAGLCACGKLNQAIEEADTEEFLIQDIYGSSEFFSVDEAGNITNSFNQEEYQKLVDEAGYNTGNIMPQGVADGVLFFDYYPEGAFTGSGDAIIAVEPSTGSVEKVMDTEKGYYINYIDNYNGNIYIGISNSDTGKSIERCFKKNGEGLSFEEDTDAHRELDGYYLVYNLDGKNGSIARSLDEFGFVLLRNHDYDAYEYAFLKPDGSIESFDFPDKEDASVYAYDKNYLIYDFYNQEYDYSSYYMYSFDNKKAIAIDEPNINRAVGYTNGTFYYTMASEVDSFHSDGYQLFGYNTDSCVAEKIYECKSIPGTNDLESNIILEGDNLFCNQLNGNKLNWCRIDSPEKVTDLGVTSREIKIYDYGTVISEKKIGNCPKCGAPLCKLYEEAFVLDSKYSSKADKINEVLSSAVNKLKQRSKESVALNNAFADDCDAHGEDSDVYCETNENTVSEVRIIHDNYLVVDMSSYWYGGGAHGLPGRDEFVFDLTTGEELTLKDFYKGSDDDFKKLVAEKVRADYEEKSKEEFNPYFAETADELYNQVYEYTHVDSNNFYLNEDSVIYYFYPYELASYADGFMEYKFTYQEMFGTDSLTR